MSSKISIQHVEWRDGRPRFSPGPKLRVLGYKAEDLKILGHWMTAEQATAWSSRKHTEILARRAGAPVVAVKPVNVYTMADLFAEWAKTPKMRGETAGEGKRVEAGLAATTINSYAKAVRYIAASCPELYAAPVDSLNKAIIYGAYEDLWAERGLACTRMIMATISSALGWGMKRGKTKLEYNPCKDQGMQTPEPRLRALTPVQVAHLVAAADVLDLPEIGDSILLGVWTGQRQGDRLQLIDAGLTHGRRRFVQAKTGAAVEIPEAPQLAARLAAAKRRRAGWKVQPIHLVVNESNRRPYVASTYRHHFQAVRAAAVEGVAVDGVQRLAPMPDLVDADTGLPRDQDLRDTAVTWLAAAECTIPQICSITGHSQASAAQVLKHYLAHHPDLAAAAIAKVVTWYDRQDAVTFAGAPAM